MNCNQQIKVARPRAGWCIPEVFYRWLSTALSIVTDGCGNNFTPYITSIAAPQDTTAIWNRVDQFGCPKGDYVFYQGEWRKKPTVPIGSEMEYEGPMDGLFDPVTLEGIHGEDMDGWKVITADANKFTVIAQGFNNGTGQWEASFNGDAPAATGGTSSVILTLGQVPRPARPAVTVRGWGADSEAPDNTTLYGSGEAGVLFTLLAADPGNLDPAPLLMVPPWKAKARLKYIGICL